ncbi:MAG: hypothetical protein ONB42_23665 [candidate division KSB1 bacterium]|nr:hypothetical protein [candidate division KSB1 bacterium]MDZ7312033.1 hypothetical protein [candidate division KSB1 bacterium]
MKTSPHIFAIYFSVIAFELFYQQFPCLSEKLAALGFQPADKMSALHFHRDGCANVHDNSCGMTMAPPSEALRSGNHFKDKLRSWIRLLFLKV